MSEIPAETAHLNAQLSDAQKMIDAYLDLIESGNFNASMMDKFNELDSQKAHLLRVLEDLKLKEKKNCYSRDQVLEFFFQYTNLQVVEKNAEGCAPNA